MPQVVRFYVQALCRKEHSKRVEDGSKGSKAGRQQSNASGTVCMLQP